MTANLDYLPSLDFEAGMRNVSADASSIEPVTIIIAIMVYEIIK